jgi:Domain of unknown function (DUF1707)/Cell wall-active antibiotics response 4TMS YvqF
MDAHNPNPALPAAVKPAMRASDQERDQVASALGEALATGRLTSTEHAERIEAAYAARTVADLVPLTADLPAVRESGGSAPATIERQQVAAVFSKVNRGGRWVAGRRTELRSTFGALIVDLSDAVLPGREIVLDANSFCGKLIVTVPGNARIIDEGGALFGKRTVAGGRSRSAGQAGNAGSGGSGTGSDADEDGPVIRVTGNVRFGKLVIHRAGAGDQRWPWRMG